MKLCILFLAGHYAIGTVCSSMSISQVTTGSFLQAFYHKVLSHTSQYKDWSQDVTSVLHFFVLIELQGDFTKIFLNEGQQDGVEGIPGLPWGCRSTRGGRGQHEKIKYELFDNARYLQKPHTWSNWNEGEQDGVEVNLDFLGDVDQQEGVEANMRSQSRGPFQSQRTGGQSYQLLTGKA
uniref:Uncharacterized protein n=1 Tax=Triticum urartu TaxID=4572 RepID=A0A8R7UTK8_TRIUA